MGTLTRTWPWIGCKILRSEHKSRHLYFNYIAERNLLKLTRKQELNVIDQVCVFFGPIEKKAKIIAPSSDWLRHFQVFLWNRWTEFAETKITAMANSSRKVAHYTQVNDMWPFGPLVSLKIEKPCLNILKAQLTWICNGKETKIFIFCDGLNTPLSAN